MLCHGPALSLLAYTQAEFINKITVDLTYGGSLEERTVGLLQQEIITRPVFTQIA